ncbi:hypothetical protein ACLVWU_16980 [Bdellovibrio sp. HCB290]|uniref:hypothetical protein n=1 Tax=Bdellovibrio sp. HCB290 TaxID=3394356 RepID=UPI0039B3BD13
MKKMVLPVIGALFCLQFVAGCIDSSQKASPIRIENGRNRKTTEKALKESSIQAKDFDFRDDDAYRIYVDPIVANITQQEKNGLGLTSLIKTRAWKTMSLYKKPVPNEFYFTLRSEEMDIAWIAPSKLWIDKTTYGSYLTEDRAKILLTMLVTTMRLETKGLLKGFESDTEDATEAVEGLGGSEIMAVANPRRPLPKNTCKNPELANLPECVAIGADNSEKRRKKMLTEEDVKNIKLGVEYLFQSGRNSKLTDIKTKLKELTIID